MDSISNKSNFNNENEIKNLKQKHEIELSNYKVFNIFIEDVNRNS